MLDTTIQQFNQQGFYHVTSPVISLEKIDHAYERVQKLLEGYGRTGFSPKQSNSNPKSARLQQITQIHWTDPAFYTVITDPGIGQWLHQLTQCSSARVWGSQLYIKPSGIKQEMATPWHRDQDQVPFLGEAHYTIWIPLMDIEEDGGHLEYIAGSHLVSMHPLLPKNQSVASYHNIYQLEENSFSVKTTYGIPKGGISIHHAKTIHGSGFNQSRNTRYAIAIGVITNHTQLYPHLDDQNYLQYIEDDWRSPIIHQTA